MKQSVLSVPKVYLAFSSIMVKRFKKQAQPINYCHFVVTYKKGKDLVRKEFDCPVAASTIEELGHTDKVFMLSKMKDKNINDPEEIAKMTIVEMKIIKQIGEVAE